MTLHATIASLSTVTCAEKEEMFLLHGRSFCDLIRETFMADMQEKDWVILLRDRDNALAGFSTLQLISLDLDGRSRRFIFSGDTVVDQSHWHDSSLAGAFGHFMLRTIAEYPTDPIHWFLISKGHRTYRFLPVFFRTYFPSCDWETPPDASRLLEAVASHKFGPRFDTASGLIRPEGTRDRLRPDLARIPGHRMSDPHNAFFLQRNPRYHLGEELACLADVTPQNLNHRAQRVIRRTEVLWRE